MKQKRPVKVLQIVGAMNRGGTETMLMNLYRDLSPDVVQFDFISYSMKAAVYDQEIKDLGGKVFKLKKPGSIKEIYQVIKREGPYDVVHAHTLSHCGIANLAAFFAGVKIRVAHAHTTFDDRKSILRKVYILLMRKLILIFSTHLLACSKAAGSYLFGKKGIRKLNYAFFPNAIDYSSFIERPTTDIKKFKLQEGLGNTTVIGHIGRFSKEKNHLFLIEMMKKIVKKDSTMKLLLVGDGELRTFIEKKARNEHIQNNIHFVGIRDDVNILLHSMDVFVFPSTYEGLGLVLLEAQACGVPCLASEAIQPEADMKLGLLHKVSLKEGADTWAENVIALKEKKIKNEKKIKTVFEASDYSKGKRLQKLMQIYQADAGEAYEENSNRFI